jgi:hypothetical protein
MMKNIKPYELKDKDYKAIENRNNRESAIWWYGIETGKSEMLSDIRQLLNSYKKQCIPHSSMWVVCNSIINDLSKMEE